MSDEQTPNEPTDEELLAVLNDAELLKAEGFRITPKGHMAMILMEMGVPSEDAGRVAQAMEDRIFLDGWIYLREENLQVADSDE